MPWNQTRNMVDTPRCKCQGLFQSKELFKKCFLWRASNFTHFSQHRHALAIMISLIWACGIHYFIASLIAGRMTNSLFLVGEKLDQKTLSFNSASPHLRHFFPSCLLLKARHLMFALMALSGFWHLRFISCLNEDKSLMNFRLLFVFNSGKERLQFFWQGRCKELCK